MGRPVPDHSSKVSANALRSNPASHKKTHYDGPDVSDAFKYLAVTRVLACMFVMPLLTIMMDFAGMVGGYVAEATVSGMSWQLYFDRAFSYINYSDLLPATLKTVVFGYLIATVASYLGFTTSRGTEGVGDASTRSVVMASILIILSDVILVKVIFFFYPQVSV